MAQTTLSVRMDAEVKRQLDALCADVGMSISTAINMFAKAFIRERRLPFDVVASDSFYSESNIPNKETLEAIHEVEELKKDPNKKTYGSFAELLEDLDE